MTPKLRHPRFLLTSLCTLAVLGTFGVVASNASTTGEAANRTRRVDRFGHGERISRLLVLDSSQRAKVADLVTRLRGEVSPIRESHRKLRAQLKAEIAAPTPDAERIGRLMLDLHSSRGTVRSALERFDQDLSALLRPEQLARYQDWKQRHPRLSGERGRGGHRGLRERREHGRHGAAGSIDGARTEGATEEEVRSL